MITRRKVVRVGLYFCPICGAEWESGEIHAEQCRCGRICYSWDIVLRGLRNNEEEEEGDER